MLENRNLLQPHFTDVNARAETLFLRGNRAKAHLRMSFHGLTQPSKFKFRKYPNKHHVVFLHEMLRHVSDRATSYDNLYTAISNGLDARFDHLLFAFVVLHQLFVVLDEHRSLCFCGCSVDSACKNGNLGILNILYFAIGVSHHHDASDDFRRSHIAAHHFGHAYIVDIEVFAVLWHNRHASLGNQRVNNVDGGVLLRAD
mmetsp:Transcript_61/g.132  ORF Transcript_61/g.132 Transcript_61/m.132 type:complete len:200 (+) Transcript_61:710-1309(+)